MKLVDIICSVLLDAFIIWLWWSGVVAVVNTYHWWNWIIVVPYTVVCSLMLFAVWGDEFL